MLSAGFGVGSGSLGGKLHGDGGVLVALIEGRPCASHGPRPFCMVCRLGRSLHCRLGLTLGYKLCLCRLVARNREHDASPAGTCGHYFWHCLDCLLADLLVIGNDISMII